MRCAGAGASLTERAATGRLHRQSLGAQAHGVIDAIVSIKTFRNATLRRKFFLQSSFARRSEASENFKKFKCRFWFAIPKTNFMQNQSGTYPKFPFSSFPLILRHAILEASFVASAREVYLLDIAVQAALRPSPLGRGPTGRTPHC